jgi:8-oxo-dGTP pyrophosphatase MutT (NUDIX family)
MIYKERPQNFDPRFEVASCFLEHDGKFLLLLRHDHKPQGNTWGAPAGKIENGETGVDAITREIQEETGYLADPQELTGLQILYVRYPEYDFVYHTYRLKLARPHQVVLEPAGHKEYCWVTPQEAFSLQLIPDMDTVIRLFYRTPES